MGVLRLNGQFHLVAGEPIAAGTLLFTLTGVLTRTPTRYSLQVEENLHLDREPHALEVLLDEHYWCFMNHHCEPTVVVRGQDVYALRALQVGDEITFNYNTTEYAMAEAFACRCGSPHCQGEVAGFASLTPEAQEALRPWLAPHLLRLLPTPTTP